MKIYISHPPHRDNPVTYLAADASAGSTNITVKNTAGFVVNKFALIGRLGYENSELVPISSISGDNTIVLDSALKFTHTSDTPVILFDWDQIKVYRSTDGIDGNYSIVATKEIDVSSDVTVYEDSSATANYYYKFSPYNSTTGIEGDLSDPVSGSGYPFYSVKTMTDRVLSLFGDTKEQFISRDEVLQWFNELKENIDTQMAIKNKRFSLTTQDITLESDVDEYTLNSDFLVERAIIYSEDGTNYKYPCPLLNIDAIGESATVGRNFRYQYTIINDKIKFYPTPSGTGYIKIYYVPVISLLNVDTDILPIPLRYRSGIFVKYALALAYLKDKKFNEYEVLMAEVNNQIKSFIKFIQVLQTRHPKYTANTYNTY